MKRSKRIQRRRRKLTSKLSFEKLEPRQLLAGDVLGPHQAAGFIPTGSNLVVNGDFEDVGTDNDNFFSDNDVAGWVAQDSATGQELNIFEYDSEFTNVLDLDSTANQFDRVYQDILTNPGDNYIIAFDYSIHPTEQDGSTANTNTFQVWWDGQLRGEFTGADYWQTGVISVEGGDANSTRLLFCELEEGLHGAGDGLGALLDNIRVVKVNEVDIPNGSFESNSTERDLFYRNGDVDSWNAINTEVNDRWVKVVEEGTTVAGATEATDGSHYLNLDATAETRDIIYTDIATTAGQTYFVTFDLRVDGGPDNIADQLRVRWNAPLTSAGDASQWAGTIIGNADWSSYGLVLTADAAEMRLLFLEPGETTGDGSGPLIDNVQLFEIESGSLVVDGNGSTAAGISGADTFVPDLGAQRVAEAIELTHPDSEGTLTSATIRLDGIQDANREILAVSESAIPLDSDGENKIENLGYEPSTNQLVLTGTATAAEYQEVIRSLTYFNSSDFVSGTSRSINVSVTDASLPNAEATASADIAINYETDIAAIDDAVIQKYIADNNIDNVQSFTTFDGIGPLYYVVNDPGTGLNPTINDSVRVSYEGYLLEVDSLNNIARGATFDANSNASFPLTGVIRGWTEGIPLIREGGDITLLIPSALAYGTTGTPGSGEFVNDVLVFDVELLQIL